MRIAAQLYTLREFTKTADAFEDSLRMLHGIGYEGVQLSAVGCMDGPDPEVNASQARELLDAHGLVACATHRPWDRLRDHTSTEIEFHRTLGCTYTAVSGLWGRPNTAAAYREWLAEAAPAMAAMADAGLRFGYHNHAHEFVRDAETGQPCYDVFVEEGRPHLMLEIDTYWVIHAGLDPAKLLRRASGRIQVVHLKDREVAEGVGPVMAPVGEGLLDWDAILEACREGGTEWLVVEQDECRRDPFECLASSFDFLSERV